MKLYLLVMVGQGDTNAKLVTENIWNWIFSPDTPGRPAGKTGWLDPATPDSVKADLMTNEPEDCPTGEAFITSGSFQNDRALQARGEEVPFDGYGDSDAPSKAREWAKANGHEIVEKWEGYIY